MRLKSFYAKTMTEAMQMVRDTLGEDAIIVATREEKGGKSVRVTAAVDPADYDDRAYGAPAFETHGRDRPSTSETWLQYDDEMDENAVAEEITDAMLRHAVPEDIMDQILSCATVIGFEQPSTAMVAAVEHLFHFTPLPSKPAKKPLLFVGPPGAGKTLAVAKAAARSTMDGLNVGVITTDTVRAGGVEQLEAFTNLLNVRLHRADGAKGLKTAVEKLNGCDQIVIDTAGANPFDTEAVKDLARLIGAVDSTPYLVLPAGFDAEESGEMGRVFSTIGAHTLLPTRIDVARRLGGLLSAAHHGGMAIANASNTPKVAEGFAPMTPESFSKLLMPSAFRADEALRQSMKAPQKRRSRVGSRQ